LAEGAQQPRVAGRRRCRLDESGEESGSAAMSAIFQRRRLDTTLFLAVAALLGIGLLLVASSTLGGRNADLTTRQALWMAIGLAAMLGMLAMDYRVLLKFSFPIYVASLVPLVYLLAFGHRIAHVRSWVKVGGYQF